MMSVNQIGRELTKRLVEKHDCELSVAIRFFYNSDLYRELESRSCSEVLSAQELDALFEHLEKEYTLGV